MSDQAEYEIRTVADFLKVPSDRRENCLADFDAWLDYVEVAAQMVIPDVGRVMTDVFRWKDDDVAGIREVVFHISTRAAPTEEMKP